MAEIIQLGKVRQLDRIEGQLDNGNDTPGAEPATVSVVPEPEISPEQQATLQSLAAHIHFLSENAFNIHHIFGIAVLKDNDGAMGYRIFHSPATGPEYALDHRILGLHIDKMLTPP